MNKVWLVTGSASGLGRNIAEAVLESGDRLVATARDTKRLDDLVKKYGDRVRAVPLDVTDESAAQAAVQTAVAAFGRLEAGNSGEPRVGNDDQRRPFGTTLEGCASRTAAMHCTPCRRPRDTRRRQGYLSH